MKSFEIGWIVQNACDDFFDRIPCDESGHFIPCSEVWTDNAGRLYVEADDFDESRVFVSAVQDVDYGFNLEGSVEPTFAGSKVREFFKSVDPNAKVHFGVIITSR